MLLIKPYNRDRAVEYARRWAFERNPLFENFAGIGGDCTNFVSQSVLAGGCVMDYTPTFAFSLPNQPLIISSNISLTSPLVNANS